MHRHHERLRAIMSVKWGKLNLNHSIAYKQKLSERSCLDIHSQFVKPSGKNFFFVYQKFNSAKLTEESFYQ